MANPTPTLDEQYLQTVNDQRNYLQRLQEAFNLHCDQITAETEGKLTPIPETDTDSRGKIIDEQKKKLSEALAQLKTEIENSSNATRKKLEEINTQREALKLKEIEDMMTK
jgi:hypothetical protein